MKAQSSSVPKAGKLARGSTPTWSQVNLWLFVDALVQTPYQLRHGNLEDLTDSEQRGHGDGASGLNLLPVPGGEAEAQHVLLRVPVLFP